MLSGRWSYARYFGQRYETQGIDVSAHNGEIDWTAVANDEIDFVYIKATEGGDWVDARYSDNSRKARAAGLHVGAYHFFTLKTPGHDQAKHFIATVPKEQGMLIPAVDLEFHGNSEVRPSVRDFQKELLTFMEMIESHYGVEPMVYTVPDFASAYLRGVPFRRLWICETYIKPWGFASGWWSVWQYSHQGSVAGIEGPVDRNALQPGVSIALPSQVSE
ncbi:MAG: hypothetical protein KF812_00565 [Fimbriimonadaceae bacterium]|nr:hypothetical protein [Fimbriimonadaceae bacterium]